MRSVFVCDSVPNVERVYDRETRELLKREAGLCQQVFSREAVLAEQAQFAQVEYIFSTWGMPSFTEEEIRGIFPALKCVFYGAGSVQTFARPFLNCGVRVFSAWQANAVPVAEYTVSLILLANKGFFSASRLLSCGQAEASSRLKTAYPGNYGETVGLIGVGQVARAVIRLLKHYNLKIRVCDPFLPDQEAQKLGVEKCALEELFSTCQVVSNHMANNASTKGMLQEKHFASMRPHATFLNTGRGAQVVEADLARVLEARPDLTAVLDVTEPEPPLPGHDFYRLPNCILSPHMAGSSGDEVCRMAQYMAQEYLRFAAGQPCPYEVTLKMLETMA